MSENDVLLQKVNGSVESDSGPKSVKRTFILMSLCFALNHATVTAIIPLATSQFGDNLGNTSTGILYLFYTLTALFASTAIVGKLGHKWSLFMGCATYSIYVLGMFLGVLTHNKLQWVFVLIAGAFGGIAAGFLWTAQGGYFSNAAKQHARYEGIEETKATSEFSGLFAMVYLAFELVLKILSSLLYFFVCADHWDGNFLTGECGNEFTKDTDFIKNIKFKGVVISYLVFTAVAVASSIGMLFIPNLSPPVDAKKQEARHWTYKAIAAVKLMHDQPKILMIGMMNVLFGFTAQYLNSYVTGTIIKDSPHLGKDKIGYFVSIIPLVASSMSVPLSKLNTCANSKTPAMMIGIIAFLVFGGFFWVSDLDIGGWKTIHTPSPGTAVPAAPFPETPSPGTYAPVSGLQDDIGNWGVLIPLFVVFGIGRAVWEGPFKAIIADMFKEDSEAAFANIILQLGVTSSIAFLGQFSAFARETLCVIFAVLSFIGYFLSVFIHKRDLQKKLVQSLEEGNKDSEAE
eukprot:TRINITY_DN116_c0_g2_i1.p1 TRINITY_DN116_c0_g2~~TRINITY_DN116_c0_g2_i1.p1  ORF type:complete len:532 (+),score=122.38 TRINITY_DN116_c0_g2_i1:52-1596(+)